MGIGPIEISMNFAFTEEQEALRDAARGFLADHSSSEQVRAAMESDLGYDPEVWKRIATELAWPAVGSVNPKPQSPSPRHR